MSTERISKGDENPFVKMVQNDAFKGRIKSLLSKHVTEEMFIRLVLNALHRNPKIAQCTPESIQLALLDAAKTGLDPSGRQASLVPRYNKNIGANELHFEVGYEGMIDVAYRTGATKKIDTRVIYANDKFDCWEDEDGFHFKHIRNLDQRGAVRAVLAKAVLSNGEVIWELVGRDELEAIAKCSPSGAGPRSGPFADQMDRKGGVRRLFKYIPKSTPEQAEEFNRVLDVDDKSYELVLEPPAPRLKMGQTVVPALEQENIRLESPLNYDGEPIEKPKRKRRTKAEMEAQKEPAEVADTDNDEMFKKFKQYTPHFRDGEEGLRRMISQFDSEEELADQLALFDAES